jgi:hypothetical protein
LTRGFRFQAEDLAELGRRRCHRHGGVVVFGPNFMAQPVSTDDMSMCAREFARFFSTSVLLITLVGVAGCKEEGGVKVTSMTFNGVKAVKPNQLKAVLATNASSKLPWGEKQYFSRDQPVRGRPEANRRLLPRPRVSGRAGDVLRRQAQ